MGKRKRTTSKSKPRKKRKMTFDKKVLKAINDAQSGGGWGDLRAEFGAAASIVKQDKVVKLKYAEFRDLTMSDTLNNNHDYVIYRPDSPYDPRYAVGGHQPFGWDQLSQFYTHYVVLGARLKATVWSKSFRTSPYPVVVYAHLQDDVVDPLHDASYWMENKAVSKKMLAGMPFHTPTDIQRPTTVNAYYSHRKFYNTTNTRTHTPVGDNPNLSTVPYFLVGAQALDQGEPNVDDLQVLIEIDYTVMLKDPIEQNPS